MRDRLANFAFGLDVLLLAVFAIAWATSFVVGYTGVFVHGGRAVAIDTCRGEVSFWAAAVTIADRDDSAGFNQMIYDRNVAATTQEWYLGTRMDKWGVFFLDFGYVRAAEMVQPVGNRIAPNRYARGIVFPFWSACVLLAI